MLEEVKIALRSTSPLLDSEVETLISACKLDLGLAGVTIIDDDDPLIKQAIKFYAKANFGYDNSESEKFQKAYDSLKCSLSLAGDYNGKVE